MTFDLTDWLPQQTIGMPASYWSSPLITATITDPITTVKHWQEKPPSTKGRKQ